MGVTTEPPTLHKSSGVAARNGTTTHVINFTTDGSAPFTPATGSFLVLFIGGGVTNANAGGWTEVEQPVSTGELSCFTKTAGAAGADNTVTITHNASNYPCGFIIKEYPAGSSVTSSTPSTSANDTFPTLSGLTGGAGNERVIDAAFLRIADGGESGASAVWGGSFVEDADTYVAQATTDGLFFTSGHQINVTATSSTPSITPTYGGTWTVNDREKIVIAINAVAPPTTSPFTKDVTESYRVFNTFTKDVQERYRVTNAFTKDQADTWRLFNALTKDLVERYRVYAVFTKDVVEAYRVLNGFTKDTVERYRVLNGWTKDQADSWRVLNALLVNKADSWRVFNAFTKDVAENYTILNGTGFIKDVVESFRVYNGFTADRVERYRVLAPLLVDKVERYRVTNGLVVDRADSWRVYALFTKDIVERYRILTDVPTPPLSADVTAYLDVAVTVNLEAEMVTAYL